MFILSKREAWSKYSTDNHPLQFDLSLASIILVTSIQLFTSICLNQQFSIEIGMAENCLPILHPKDHSHQQELLEKLTSYHKQRHK